MLDVLKFIFQDFWHFLGSWLLVGTIAGGIGGLYRTINIRRE